MKRNYRLEMEREINSFERDGRVPSLLLHCCCAPCSSSVLEQLTDHFYVTVYFYNPNIYSEEEYIKRKRELERLIAEQPAKRSVAFTSGPYEPEKFEAIAAGLEDEPERGSRCHRCYRLRLEAAGREASRIGADYFTTTLSVSPLKDAEVLNSIGASVSEMCHVPYLFSDFKKKDGFLRSIRLSEEYHLYRQDYCGCRYSKRQQ
jgi:predicted adenine nucleotide alpha hydrolase (AANH) superfamily ATPase